MAHEEPARYVVVVGASAGGVEALESFAAGLPADLPAAVLVVLHIPGTGESLLARILDRAGPLPARDAHDGEVLRAGRLYTAVNDRHLLVKHNHVLLNRAPKQNRLRPCADALFRSAARWWGARAAGVVLSGFLDDGAAGLAAIDAMGGAALVQDPREAIGVGMPESALAVVPHATVAAAGRLGEELTVLIKERTAERPATADPDLIRETEMLESPSSGARGDVPGEPVSLGCPDCNGGMTVIRTGAAVHYLCHVGHSWSPQTLAAAQREKVEQALWTAVSMLEEQAAVYRNIAKHVAGGRAAITVRHQLAAAEEASRAASVIRKNFPDLLPHISEESTA